MSNDLAHPLRFRPLIKQILWGGRRLGEHLGKPIGDEDNYAESWEIVDHGEDQSVVVDGPFAGNTLHDLFVNHRAWLLGEAWTKRHAEYDTFPLLLKFLDCNRVLSVQVHPDDTFARKMSPPDLGKTEAWVILDAGPDSVIYAGLKNGIDHDQLASLIESGRTEEALHQFKPKVGDCVFIPAGTVHALGGGLLVAEIQQSSNTTFRLFDWNRVDVNGNGRELHIQPSLDVTDYRSGPVQPVEAASSSGCQTLVECDKFVLRRVDSHEISIGGDDQCHLLCVIDGSATMSVPDETGATVEQTLPLGCSVLMPAAMSAAKLHVTGSVLWMTPQ